jgi:hypothetical protein
MIVMEAKGKKIMDVLETVQQFFSEIAQVLKKIDDEMENKGWTSLYSDTTAGRSSSLEHPDVWLPFVNFRVYSKTKKSNQKKIISICYSPQELNQPIIIAGLVEYKKNSWKQVYDYWVLWISWIYDRNGEKKLNGRIYQKFTYDPTSKEPDYTHLFKKRKLFAYNLTDITNENDIKTKISDKLIELS